MAKICFDGLNLGLARGTGVATYTRALAGLARDMGHRTGILYTLDRRLPRDPLAGEVLFFDAQRDLKVPPLLRAARAVIGGIGAAAGVRPRRLISSGTVITRQFQDSLAPSDEQFVAHNVFDNAQGLFSLTGRFLPVRFDERPDLFHWTFPLPMTSNARANIYTVHDLVPVRLPFATLDRKRYYIAAMRRILARADHIVTVSENSRRDIVTHFGVDEKRITNTYQAVNIPAALRLRATDDIANELDGVFGLEMKKYLLFFGSLEPKKNVSRLVQAYLEANIDIPLVIVIAQSWQAESEKRLLKQVLDENRGQERSGERRVRRYDYVPFRQLVSLIQGARGVVFPSLYEGFGLPVLEAMTLGTPVITANTSSLPEVAGDAALQVDPYDVGAIRDAIIAVAKDDALCADLSRRGLEQAERFSLENYRRRVEALYASLL